PAEVDALDVPTRPVSDEGELMHHKYVVRDARDVWTGSTNWTPDAFTREENVILELFDVPELASAYAANFERIWRQGHLERSGAEGPTTTLARGVEAGVRVLPRASVALAGCRAHDRGSGSPDPHLLTGRDLGRGARAAGRARGAEDARARRRLRPDADGGRATAMAGRGAQPMEDRGVGHDRSAPVRQGVDAVCAGERPRLHAREVPRGRRRGHGRQLQLLAAWRG